MKRELHRERSDPKHRANNPRRRVKHVKAKTARPALKRDKTYINISDEMKHGRGPRR